MANELREYRRRADTGVTAVQLNLDMDGLEYRKWGAVQRASSGDWLLNGPDGEAYTVPRDTFERTYRMVQPGLYRKVASVWARPAESDGAIQTKEGETRYVAGDMLVYTDSEGTDGYAMPAETFEQRYEPAT